MAAQESAIETDLARRDDVGGGGGGFRVCSRLLAARATS
jgi:hypothetical protein